MNSFKEHRQRAGLLLEEAAERLGLAVETLSGLESGEHDYSGQILRDMAALYDCRVVDLVAGRFELPTQDNGIDRNLLARILSELDALDRRRNLALNGDQRAEFAAAIYAFEYGRHETDFDFGRYEEAIVNAEPNRDKNPLDRLRVALEAAGTTFDNPKQFS